MLEPGNLSTGCTNLSSEHCTTNLTCNIIVEVHADVVSTMQWTEHQDKCILEPPSLQLESTTGYLNGV